MEEIYNYGRATYLKFKQVLKYNEWKENHDLRSGGDFILKGNCIHIYSDNKNYHYNFWGAVEDVHIHHNDFSTFLKLLEVVGITFKPLPVESEFDFKQGLIDAGFNNDYEGVFYFGEWIRIILNTETFTFMPTWLGEFRLLHTCNPKNLQILIDMVNKVKELESPILVVPEAVVHTQENLK